MARPRDIRFYEEPLGDLPETQLWLIEYHENSRKLVEYLSKNGAGCTAYHTAIRCVTLLREYLIGIEEAYTAESALQWHAKTGPHPKGFLADLYRLADLSSYGEVRPENAFPRALPYSQKLSEPWDGILNGFLGTLNTLLFENWRLKTTAEEIELEEIAAQTKKQIAEENAAEDAKNAAEGRKS